MREGCSVALMGLLLDTIPDWGLSLRVVFTTFAICMVTARILVERGIIEAVIQTGRNVMLAVTTAAQFAETD